MTHLLRLKPHTLENYRVLQVNMLQNKKQGCQSHISNFIQHNNTTIQTIQYTHTR